MSKWLDLALAASEPLPKLPKMPKSTPPTSFGNFGNFGRGSVTSDRPDSGSPDWDVWAERAAIVEHDGGRDRGDAENATAVEQGYPDQASMFTVLAECWHRRLEEVLEGRRLCRQGERHIRTAVRFIAEGYAQAALAAGWQPLELLGTDPKAAWARLDVLGAAYFEGDPIKVTANAIARRTGTGAILTFRKRSPGNAMKFPWEEGNDARR